MYIAANIDSAVRMFYGRQKKYLNNLDEVFK